MTAECLDCGWTGDEDVLEKFKCPKCGSRHMKTTGSLHSSEDGLSPPEGARDGE